MDNAFAFLLVSSNGKNSSNKAGAVGKSFQPLQGEDQEIEKAPCLPLDLDIVNLQHDYKSEQILLRVCETSMHKKGSLKKRSQILNEIKQFYSNYLLAKFYFTGHGYANGDLCIETQENPDGEKLQIEEILDILIQGVNKSSFSKNIHVFIDACYSGRNVERAKEYLLKVKPNISAIIICSSGPQYTSIVTSVGSLLIAKLCQQTNPRIKQNRKQLAKKFEARKPISLWYDFKEDMKQPKISVQDQKF